VLEVVVGGSLVQNVPFDRIGSILCYWWLCEEDLVDLGFGWLFLSSGAPLLVGLESGRDPWELGRSHKTAGLWWNCIEGGSRFVANLRSDFCDYHNFVGLMSFGTTLVGRYVGFLIVGFDED